MIFVFFICGKTKSHFDCTMHFVDAFQVFLEVFDMVFILEMNLKMYSGLLQFWEEEFENNQHKEIECIDVNEHWYKTVNNEWKLKTVMVFNIIMKMWNDLIQVMKIMKFQWKQWEYSTCCHHLFPSGADVIQIDGRYSFIDGVEIIAQYQLLQIQNKREVLESSSFWSIRCFGRDDGSFNCWRMWLNEMYLWVVWEQRDWFGQWIILRWCVCDSVLWTGSLWGKEEVNCLGWVLCLFGGRGLPVGTTGHPLVCVKICEEYST